MLAGEPFYGKKNRAPMRFLTLERRHAVCDSLLDCFLLIHLMGIKGQDKSRKIHSDHLLNDQQFPSFGKDPPIMGCTRIHTRFLSLLDAAQMSLMIKIST